MHNNLAKQRCCYIKKVVYDVKNEYVSFLFAKKY